MKQLLLFLIVIVSLQLHAQKGGGYAIVRVFDCTRGAASGKEFMDPQILIIYETGDSEVIDLDYFSEKSEPENLKLIVAAINSIRQKGYSLISSTTSGTQGNLTTEYVFLKP